MIPGFNFSGFFFEDPGCQIPAILPGKRLIAPPLPCWWNFIDKIYLKR
jgi:hypothetical protein